VTRFFDSPGAGEILMMDVTISKGRISGSLGQTCVAAWQTMLGLACLLTMAPWAFAQPEAQADVIPRAQSKDPPGMKRLAPDFDLWIDTDNKRVAVDGTVCLREGALEMFACPRRTKEHESIVAVDSKAFQVHAALLAVGARSGSPAKFRPEYVPASGTEIDIDIVWTDSTGAVHRDKAQNWVKNAKTGKPLEYSWVFAGSSFGRNEFTKQEVYAADSGDFICVSNFPTAMLDLPVESSESNADLLFVAFTENIPPVGTRVRLVLTPKPQK
jgi:hypothetical protein